MWGNAAAKLNSQLGCLYLAWLLDYKAAYNP